MEATRGQEEQRSVGAGGLLGGRGIGEVSEGREGLDGREVLESRGGREGREVPGGVESDGGVG